MYYTYRTKIIGSGENITKEIEYLNEYGKTFGVIERKMYVDLVFRKLTKSNIKKDYCAKFHITSRQFNSIYSQVDGKIKSIHELKKLESLKIEEKIKSISKTLEKLLDKKIKTHEKLINLKNKDDINKVSLVYKKLKFSIHQKKRKSDSLNNKLQKIKKDSKEKIVRICFGGKDLFKKQYNLKDNGFINHEKWLSEWKNKRSNQMTFLGSKDES